MAFLDSFDSSSDSSEKPSKLSLPVLVALAALILVLLFLLLQQGLGMMRGDSITLEAREQAPSQDESSTSSETPSLVVYVTGAVITPNVYHLKEGDRVADAVAAAGGFTESAASAALNLARPLVDGEQIHVPDLSAQTPQDSAAAQEGAVTQGATGAPSGIDPSGKVNINQATASELETLDGIGPATAQKIIDSRANEGPFSSIEDLTRVSGIGEKRLAAIADKICL